MNDRKMLPKGRETVEGAFDPEVVQPTLFRTVKGKKTLHEWIRSQFAREDQEGFITSIVMEHQVAPNSYEVHHTINIGQANSDPVELGKLFWDIAETYCQDLPGNHFFRLCVFWNNNPMWGSIHPFVIGGRIDPTLLAAENPDQKGLLQSGMHYAQQTQDLYLRHMDSMLVRLNETLMTFASSQARLMDENQKAYDACKTLLLDKERNDQSFQMERLKYERSSNERKELLGMLMPAVNALTGKEVFQYSASDSKLLEMLVDLPEEELEKMIEIASRNNPKLFALLMSRFHAIASTKQLPHKAEEQLTGKSNPETEFGTPTSDSRPPTTNEENTDLRPPTAEEPESTTDNRPPTPETTSDPRPPTPEEPTSDSRPPTTNKDEVVKEFMNLSEEDILAAIQKDPELLKKFKARMGRGTATRKPKGK